MVNTVHFIPLDKSGTTMYKICLLIFKALSENCNEQHSEFFKIIFQNVKNVRWYTRIRFTVSEKCENQFDT